MKWRRFIPSAPVKAFIPMMCAQWITVLAPSGGFVGTLAAIVAGLLFVFSIDSAYYQGVRQGIYHMVETDLMRRQDDHTTGT